MSSTAFHKRLQSSTRMDVLTMMLNKAEVDVSSNNSTSPRDSLSPLGGDHSPVRRKGKGSESVDSPVTEAHTENPKTDTDTDASTHGATSPEQASTARIAFQDPKETHEAATSAPSPPKTACSPHGSLISRPRRPADLHLSRTNGLTTNSVRELKQRIRSTSDTGPCDATPQLARPKTRKRPLKSPVEMGNKPSSVGAPEEPGAVMESPRNIVRKPVRAMRRSSGNLFSRVDSKSPLPRPATAASVLIRPTKDEESPIDPFMDPIHSARESAVMTPLHSASTITVTGDDARQPLSAATTVKETKSSSEDHSDGLYERLSNDTESDIDAAPSVPIHRSSALSPVLPAPSPLREDSPHKYGLKDRMDTPELAEDPPAEDLTANRARRRSNGLEIFQEAKSLQSAQSFLNSLSTSRRRAESQTRTTDTWATTLTGGSTSRPSSRPGSRMPSATQLRGSSSNLDNRDMDGRRRGHNFKSNGFAFARPLSIAQIKCYRNHTRLLRSHNKVAPVECSVCHMDDDREHWSCAWCAIRMCGDCRKDFAERGNSALRERIKGTEFGDENSPGSSDQSLELRKVVV